MFMCVDVPSSVGRPIGLPVLELQMKIGGYWLWKHWRLMHTLDSYQGRCRGGIKTSFPPPLWPGYEANAHRHTHTVHIVPDVFHSHM